MEDIKIIKEAKVKNDCIREVVTMLNRKHGGLKEMNNQVRWTVSLRRKDKQLFKHFENIGDGDRSAESRRLMYLGLSLIDMLVEGKVSISDVPIFDPYNFIIADKLKTSER